MKIPYYQLDAFTGRAFGGNRWRATIELRGDRVLIGGQVAEVIRGTLAIP